MGEGASDSDAGNYVGLLMMDKACFGTPAGVRKMLQSGVPYKCRGHDLPGFLEVVFSQFSMVSNWASSAKGLDLPGCEQLVQFPVYEINSVPFEFALIFRSRPNDVCVMYFTKKHDAKFFLE